MSELCRFRGASIHVYHDEHNPPHFHVRYSGLNVQVGIEPVLLLEGSLPANLRRLVFAWAHAHQAELAKAWDRAQKHQDPGKIAPPD